jgi:hypothetical protein
LGRDCAGSEAADDKLQAGYYSQATNCSLGILGAGRPTGSHAMRARKSFVGRYEPLISADGGYRYGLQMVLLPVERPLLADIGSLAQRPQAVI